MLGRTALTSVEVFNDSLHCADRDVCNAFGALLAGAEFPTRMYQVTVILGRPRDLHRILFNESVRERYLYEFGGMPAQKVVRNTTRAKQFLSLEAPSGLHGSFGRFATDYPQTQGFDN